MFFKKKTKATIFPHAGLQYQPVFRDKEVA